MNISNEIITSINKKKINFTMISIEIYTKKIYIFNNK